MSSSGERESQSKSPQAKSIPNGTSEEKTTVTVEAVDPESYEARRENRRKAREERLKAASAKLVYTRVHAWVCCVALPCCLFDLACFFLPSFPTLINKHVQGVVVHTCIFFKL